MQCQRVWTPFRAAPHWPGYPLKRKNAEQKDRAQTTRARLQFFTRLLCLLVSTLLRQCVSFAHENFLPCRTNLLLSAASEARRLGRNHLVTKARACVRSRIGEAHLTSTMTPIFDRHGKTVGWLVSGVIFGPHHQPQAFVRRNAVFSFSGRHLGRVETGFIRDREGHAVAFLSGAENGPLTPIAETPPPPPLLPVPPFTPVPAESPIPPTPSRSWSSVDWDHFLS